MPHWELDTEVEAPHGPDNTLNVNILSIVVGALIVLILMAWITAIKSTCEHIIDETREDRYDGLYRKYVAAVIMTLIGFFIIAGIYIWVRRGW